MLSIDRIEEQIVVCIDDDTEEEIHLRREELPEQAKEGDCLYQNETGWVIDAAETERRREENRRLLEKLLNHHEKS